MFDTKLVRPPEIKRVGENTMRLIDAIAARNKEMKKIDCFVFLNIRKMLIGINKIPIAQNT